MEGRRVDVKEEDIEEEASSPILVILQTQAVPPGTKPSGTGVAS